MTVETKSLTQTCTICGETTPEWVSVLWQKETGQPNNTIDVTDSDVVTVLCMDCTDDGVAKDLFASVLRAILDVVRRAEAALEVTG